MAVHDLSGLDAWMDCEISITRCKLTLRSVDGRFRLTSYGSILVGGICLGSMVGGC